ncbi:hypothetical protein [Campylobacter sp. RM16190]|uniref:hypothetical protein n=1 Tax=Campylobacter sp. RM16190 TaxID=1705727 RepID=UPI001472F968|nr:hypothetical protein [Campylobacter sp. RM16190]
MKNIVFKAFGFLAGNKIWLAILSSLLGVIFGMSAFYKISNLSLLDEIKATNMKMISKEIELQTLKGNLDKCNLNIENQNKKIAQISQDNERLKNIQPIVKKEIETKYIKIKPPSRQSECIKKLSYYEELFKELSR